MQKFRNDEENEQLKLVKIVIIAKWSVHGDSPPKLSESFLTIMS